MSEVTLLDLRAAELVKDDVARHDEAILAGTLRPGDWIQTAVLFRRETGGPA
jgi:hypothetical protein